MTDSPVDGDVKKSKPRISAKLTLRKNAENAKKGIKDRCVAANLKCREVLNVDSKPALLVYLKCGRDERSVYLDKDERIVDFASIDFEKWVFLADYTAICSYEHGIIESLVRFPFPGPTRSMSTFRRLFTPAGSPYRVAWDVSSVKLLLQPPQSGFPVIEISAPSEVFRKLHVSWLISGTLTLKISSRSVKMHDEAVSLLEKLAGSIFFQIDLLSDISLTLAHEPRRGSGKAATTTTKNLATDLQYPKTEFDNAPLSLYWYGRSASGMPLLQFLSFYQAIEFYFPIYSKAEAQRRVRAVLKDPTFRGDRDADIGKLLTSIYISRSGAYGDERSQLRATLTECVDATELRAFLESDSERREFYMAKGKSPYQKLSLGNPSADLRPEVSERIYDIRCNIVHTKNDAQHEEFELLLPFSEEAEQLFFDVQLVRYLAQRVLIAASITL